MKKIFVIMIYALLLVGCTTNAPEKEPTLEEKLNDLGFVIVDLKTDVSPILDLIGRESRIILYHKAEDGVDYYIGYSEISDVSLFYGLFPGRYVEIWETSNNQSGSNSTPITIEAQDDSTELSIDQMDLTREYMEELLGFLGFDTLYGFGREMRK